MTDAVAVEGSALGPAPTIPTYEWRHPHSGVIHPWVPAGLIELHIKPDSDFTAKGWGRRVREAGGSFQAARGSTFNRYVTLPYPAGRELAEEIAVTFKARCLILRGCRFTAAPDDVVLSSDRPKDWPIHVGAVEAAYLQKIAQAKASGVLIQVETDPALRADELSWRAVRAAARARELAVRQIEEIRKQITTIEAEIDRLGSEIAANTEAAARHQERLGLLDPELPPQPSAAARSEGTQS